jgi:hypothetical protein
VKLATYLQLVPMSTMVELYPQFPMLLHGVVLNFTFYFQPTDNLFSLFLIFVSTTVSTLYVAKYLSD